MDQVPDGFSPDEWALYNGPPQCDDADAYAIDNEAFLNDPAIKDQLENDPYVREILFNEPLPESDFDNDDHIPTEEELKSVSFMLAVVPQEQWPDDWREQLAAEEERKHEEERRRQRRHVQRAYYKRKAEALREKARLRMDGHKRRETPEQKDERQRRHRAAAARYRSANRAEINHKKWKRNSSNAAFLEENRKWNTCQNKDSAADTDAADADGEDSESEARVHLSSP